MHLVLLFFVGIAIGSFLNVLILRVNTGEGVGGRSRCFSCLKKLGWADLVPIASYVSIRGRCRYCKSKVSLQYPLVELVTGVIFVVIAIMMFGYRGPVFSNELFLSYALTVAFFSTLIAISVYDIRHKIIPDQFSLALFIIALTFEVTKIFSAADLARAELMPSILAALGVFGFFGGLWFISGGRWMGFGDAKIAISIGLFLSYPGILYGILFAFWSGALFGIAMMVAGYYNRKTEVPFGPFLAFGAMLAYIFLVFATDFYMWYYSVTGLS
jgi:leader peptidase (prepilin peptidase) / N-methyltransferase